MVSASSLAAFHKELGWHHRRDDMDEYEVEEQKRESDRGSLKWDKLRVMAGQCSLRSSDWLIKI